MGQADARLKEAEKLGFAAALAPPRRGRGKERAASPASRIREIAPSARTRRAVRGSAAPAAAHLARREPADERSLDIVVVGVIVLSGLFAFARGFVREVLSIAAWFGATSRRSTPALMLAPVAERFLPKGPVADAAAAIAIFLVALIVLSLDHRGDRAAGSRTARSPPSTARSAWSSAWCAARSWSASPISGCPGCCRRASAPAGLDRRGQDAAAARGRRRPAAATRAAARPRQGAGHRRGHAVAPPSR